MSPTRGRGQWHKQGARGGLQIQALTNRQTPSQAGCEARAAGFRKQRNRRRRQRNFKKGVFGSCEGSAKTIRGRGHRPPPPVLCAPLPGSPRAPRGKGSKHRGALRMERCWTEAAHPGNCWKERSGPRAPPCPLSPEQGTETSGC